MMPSDDMVLVDVTKEFWFHEDASVRVPLGTHWFNEWTAKEIIDKGAGTEIRRMPYKDYCSA